MLIMLGISQAGIAECVIQAIDACHPDMREPLLGNILLVGGCALCPNFKERL
jgi:actin-related protein 6